MDFLCSERSKEQLLQPLADLRHEHFEALAAGRRWKARWVLVRGYWSFFAAVGLFSVVKLAKDAVTIWKSLK